MLWAAPDLLCHDTGQSGRKSCGFANDRSDQCAAHHSGNPELSEIVKRCEENRQELRKIYTELHSRMDPFYEPEEQEITV